MPMSFSDRLRTLRQQHGWSQTALADASGVEQRAISRYESGAEPSLSAAVKLAHALGVTVDALAAGGASDEDWTLVRLTVDDSGAEDMRITKARVVTTPAGVAVTCRDGWTVVARSRDNALRLIGEVQR